MCSAFGSRTEPSSRNARGQDASSFAEVMRIAAGKQCDVVAERDEFLGQPMDHAFGAAIQFRRDGLRQRRDLSDAH